MSEAAEGEPNPFIFDEDSVSLADETDLERVEGRSYRRKNKNKLAERCTQEGCEKFASFGPRGTKNRIVCAYHLDGNSYRMIL